MLRHCFIKHTSRLLCALEPDVILLSGSATHPFAANIQHLLPKAKVVKTIHYANRRSNAHKMAEARLVKDIIAAKAARA
jgi:precorrin-6x reductase